MEEVKKTTREGDKVTRSNNVTFSILSQIEKTQRLPTPRQLGICKRQLLRYIKKLKADSMIIKVGYGVWELKDPQILKKEGDIFLSSSTHLNTHLQQQIRGHGYKVTLTIPKIERWFKRETYLIKNQIPYKVIPQGQSITLEGFKIWLCDKSMVIHTTKGQDFYTPSAETSLRAFMQTLYNLFKKLETTFKISFKINKTYVFRIFRQHYGKVNDPLAIEVCNQGQKLEVRNERGIWLLVDRSLNLNELETVSCQTAVPDMDKVIVPFFNDIKTYYEKTGLVPFTSDIITIQGNFMKEVLVIGEALKDITKILEALKK